MIATLEPASDAIKSVIYPNNVKQVALSAENAIRRVTLKRTVER
jgi:hypothetical protein